MSRNMFKLAADPFMHAQAMAPPRTLRQAGQQAAFGAGAAGLAGLGMAAGPSLLPAAAATGRGMLATARASPKMTTGLALLGTAQGDTPAQQVANGLGGAFTATAGNQFGGLATRLGQRLTQAGPMASMANRFPRLARFGSAARDFAANTLGYGATSSALESER